MVNLWEYKLTGTLWITFYVNGNNPTWFGNFRVEYISHEIKNLMAIQIS